MSAAAHFDTVSEARARIKDLFDAAESGRPASVRRDRFRGAFVDADRLRHFLAMLLPEAEMVAEGGEWSLFLPGLPLAADGATADEALEEMVDVLREYENEGWVPVRDARGRTGTHHITDKLALTDGRVLRTRVSHPVDREGCGLPESTVATMTKDQALAALNDFSSRSQ